MGSRDRARVPSNRGLPGLRVPGAERRRARDRGRARGRAGAAAARATRARELAGARYAALGIPDGEGALRRFITSGMSDELIAAMGPLPRTHGMLGAMLESPEPYRTDDIHADPRFRGWWPRAHPTCARSSACRSSRAASVIGAFYLTEKEGAGVRRTPTRS